MLGLIVAIGPLLRSAPPDVAAAASAATAATSSRSDRSIRIQVVFDTGPPPHSSAPPRPAHVYHVDRQRDGEEQEDRDAPGRRVLAAVAVGVEEDGDTCCRRDGKRDQ